MTAVLIGAFDLGAAMFVLVSPARSASVIRLAVGSRTVDVVSIFRSFTIWEVHRQFEPCLLWPAKDGGGIAVRELVADVVISAIVLWGEVCPYRVGCGSWDTNCKGTVSGMIECVWIL
jgi:hypothetical protein